MLVLRVVVAVVEPRESMTVAGDYVEGTKVALTIVEAVGFSAAAVIGGIVAISRPRNPIGWILLATPTFITLLGVSLDLYLLLEPDHPADAGAADLLLWFASWGWIPAVIPAFALLPLLFPTGRPLTARWRSVEAVIVIAGVVLLLGTAFEPGPLEDYGWTDNPLGIEGFPGADLAAAAFVVWLVAAVASVASLLLRFRRSRGVERQQLRWALLGAGFLVFAFIASGLASEAQLLGDDGSWIILLTALLVLPACIAVAVLRYRLYDIDVVINRALVYAALTVTLAAAYVGSVLLLQLILSPGSDLAIAGSTLAVATLFHPLRTRIQALVDRRFFRRRYDAVHTVEAFSSRVRDEVELSALAEELRDTVATTMQPAHVSLWLREARR
jgi:hypothetical protein